MLAAVNWAEVGGLSAVAVAVFTGLAYELGYRNYRRERRERTRRAAVRHLIGVQMEQGVVMAYDSATTDAQVGRWREDTKALIAASLGRAEATIFNNTEPTAKLLQLAKEGAISMDQLNAHVGVLGLGSLIQRFDALPVLEDFKPKDSGAK